MSRVRPMLWMVVAFAAAAAMASASTVKEANEFIDSLLGKYLRSEVETFRLNRVPVPNFNVTVPSNRITNRMFRAQFQHGEVLGLDRVFRRGDCLPTRWKAGNITLECILDLTTLYVSYSIVAQGHSLGNEIAYGHVIVDVISATAKFEAQSAPNRPPYIRTFVIRPPLMLAVSRKSPGRRIELNEGRNFEFKRQVRIHARRAIQNAIMSNYVGALGRVMVKYGDVLILPRVEAR